VLHRIGKSKINYATQLDYVQSIDQNQLSCILVHIHTNHTNSRLHPTNQSMNKKIHTMSMSIDMEADGDGAMDVATVDPRPRPRPP